MFIPHLKADQALEPGEFRGTHHAYNPTGWPGEAGILDLEACRIRKPAVELHEQRRVLATAAHILCHADLLHVATKDRQQIGIDHRCATPGDELDHRADFIAERDLCEAGLSCQDSDPFFMHGVAVHERHGARLLAYPACLAQGVPHLHLVQRLIDIPIGIESLVDLDRGVMQDTR